MSGREPVDLRHVDPRPAAVAVDESAAVRDIVQARLGEGGGDVLAALGIEDAA